MMEKGKQHVNMKKRTAIVCFLNTNTELVKKDLV